MWPEQEAVDTWAKGYGINASAEELYELKEAVSKPRLEVQDRLRQAEAEVERLRMALDKIANTLKYMQMETRAKGAELNGVYAIMLSKDPNYLQKIALAELDKEGEKGTYKCQNCQNLVESEYTNRLFCSYHSEGEYQHETFLDDYCNYFESKKEGER